MTYSEEVYNEIAKAIAFAKERGQTLEHATRQCTSLFYDCMEGGYDLTEVELWNIVTFLQSCTHFLYHKSDMRKKVKVFFTLERLSEGVLEYRPEHDESVLRDLRERAYMHVY